MGRCASDPDGNPARPNKKIVLEVLIEEVEAMINAEEIALSSPRLEALIFGPGDYSASQGVDTRAIGSGDGYPGTSGTTLVTR